jgi:alkanesulfonate monooxygenase SsuD/methylene tetrahydromethanopterin reductase-like flavin-dependent oxidoreductase (luciferase family)
VWVSEDPERDLEDVLSAVWYTRWKYQDMGGAYGRPSTGPLPEPPPLDGAAREQLATSLVLGTPDDVADRLGRLRAVLGDDGHVIARSYLPGMPFDRAVRAVELLGEVRRRLERPATGGPA